MAEPLDYSEETHSSSNCSDSRDSGAVSEDFFFSDASTLKSLEDEQEMLTSSLMSLTSHFAQVQLRLRQIMDAPLERRDELLKNLEEFAFRGIPALSIPPDIGGSATDKDRLQDTVESHRDRQQELIEQLKQQLEELEKYAYESGAPVLPQSVMVAKQKIIIDEIKAKINLNVNETDLPQLSSDDLRNQVDSALGEFVSPLKMKEQLVAQLKTQIADLERFIKYLQTGGFEKKMMAKGKFKAAPQCECKSTGRPASAATAASSTIHAEKFNGRAFSLLDKASTLFQMFIASQFGCGDARFQMNTLKRTYKGNHWGDLRAQLEVDVQEVLSLVQEFNKMLEVERAGRRQRLDSTRSNASGTGAELEETTKKRPKYSNPALVALHTELTTVVRKRLAISIQKLMEHGLQAPPTESRSLVPFLGCFAPLTFAPQPYQLSPESEDFREMHAWELIMIFYHMKNGDQFNETPQRMLSQSFNLDIVPTRGQSNKQSLLSAIGTVIAIHSPYKRSANAHFKAFISAGLNSRKLTQWINLIFQCRDLINTYYTHWSYATNTRFQDALKSLESLAPYEFDLPVDLAVRQFEAITDIFL